MNKTLLIAILIVVILIGGYFIFQNTSQPVPQATTQTNSSNQTTTNQQGEKEITVVGTEFSFSPAEITVKSGEKVKLNFNNDGTAPHNWGVEGHSITTKTIIGGGGDAIEFIAPAPGIYTVYCSVPGHRANGMIGKLIVE